MKKVFATCANVYGRVVMHIYRLPEGPERYPPPYEYIQDTLCCPDILTLPLRYDCVHHG